MGLKEKSMNLLRFTNGSLAAMLAAVIASGCSDRVGTGENQDSGKVTASRGEHDRDGGEHSGEGRGEHDRDGEDHHGAEGEESGTELKLSERYDNVRNGARLILAYDADSNSFSGTVENTTKKTLERVRVEVHLSNGKELGPTTPADLKPGEKRSVTLTPKTKGFEGWSAHPEVGNEEHRHGREHREGRGEHGQREGRGEHDRGGDGERGAEGERHDEDGERHHDKDGNGHDKDGEDHGETDR